MNWLPTMTGRNHGSFAVSITKSIPCGLARASARVTGVTKGAGLAGNAAERTTSDGNALGATVTAAGSGSAIAEDTIHSDAFSPCISLNLSTSGDSITTLAILSWYCPTLMFL